MRMVSIDIDEEIFSLLQKKAAPFVDSPNDVLRMLLLNKGTKNTEFPVGIPKKNNYSLPVLPGGVPKALEQTLQVTYLVRFGKMTRNNATHRIANINGVAPQTIIDKYCRQLELAAHQFDKLLEEKELKSLKELLHKKFPSYFKVINDYLGSQKATE